MCNIIGIARAREVLRIARGWSEHDSAPRNSAEHRFYEYQKARKKQRREDQVSSGGVVPRPPMSVGTSDESGQQKNSNTDTAAGVSDFDQYRSQTWIYPHRVIRQDSESGGQNGEYNRHQAQLRVRRSEMASVHVHFVDNDDDETDPD